MNVYKTANIWKYFFLIEGYIGTAQGILKMET